MRIGILTSGGDCPGINATIRGVCKTAMNHYGMEVFGIHSGFRGLVDDDVIPLTEGSLTGLLNMGGTILGTSREKPFKRKTNTLTEDKPAMMLKQSRSTSWIVLFALEEMVPRKLLQSWRILV